MARKQTSWKLDRPYDPDERADALRSRFSRYLARNGVRRRPSIVRKNGNGARMWPVWMLIAGFGIVLAVAAGIA